MIIELHDNLGNPKKIKATRVVLRTDAGQPLCVAAELSPIEHYIVHRGDGDDEMRAALSSLCIRETVISDIQPMPRPDGTLWTPGM